MVSVASDGSAGTSIGESGHDAAARASVSPTVHGGYWDGSLPVMGRSSSMAVTQVTGLGRGAALAMVPGR